MQIEPIQMKLNFDNSEDSFYCEPVLNLAFEQKDEGLVAKQDLIGTSAPHQKHFNLSTLSSKTFVAPIQIVPAKFEPKMSDKENRTIE